MLSIMPQLDAARFSLTPDMDHSEDAELNELGSVQEAVGPFVKLLSQSGTSVRLHCTVPTVCPSSNGCVDLYDLQALRNRSLVFVHELVEALRALGITASYRLQPSNCPCCVVCALPPDIDANKVKAAAAAVVENAHLEVKERALLASMKDGLALVIT